MHKRTKRRVKGIAIFIVFLAVAASIFEWQNNAGKHPTYDLKPAQNDYRDLKFVNKAQISFVSPNVTKAQAEIEKIIAEYSNKQIRKQSETSFGAYIFSVPQQDLHSIIEKLGKFGTIASKTEQVDTSLVNLDYESELARLQGYEREQADLNNVRFPTDAQNRRKEELHSLIQSTRSNLDKLKDAQSVLLYVSLVPQQKTASWEVTLSILAVNFFSWLIVFAVGAVLVYFGTRLLMYFLAALGIKGNSSGGLGGSYNYGGYGNYYNRYYSRYGYGKGKRKVKRIYKDKRSTPDSDSEEDETPEKGS
ncbi:MAG: hypothetical protein ABFC98_01935 [Candidatus Cloacimonas sp.]